MGRIVGLALALCLLAAACGAVGNADGGVGDDPQGSQDSQGGSEAFTVEQADASPTEDVPSALDDRTNEAFPEPLLDPDAIVSGGPPPDGIPPIDEPRFLRVDDVAFVQADEPVLVLELDGEVRLYPVQVMTWHEIVNDTVAGVPVTVSYCPLCNSAVAYDRRLGDRVLDFGTSGSLHQSSLVMYDRQTESLWTHFDGRAVIGHLAGEQLDLLPVSTVSWADAVEAHPDALVLSRETGFDRDYGENPYIGYESLERPFESFVTADLDDRQEAMARVVGVRDGEEAVAVRLEDVAAEGVIDVELARRRVTVWHLPGTSSALDARTVSGGEDIGATGAFVPVASDGTPLTFSRDGAGFTDAETGSSWNILGEAVDGSLAGEQLRAVEHLDTFWFAWATFEPETAVHRP